MVHTMVRTIVHTVVNAVVNTIVHTVISTIAVIVESPNVFKSITIKRGKAESD